MNTGGLNSGGSDYVIMKWSSELSYNDFKHDIILSLFIFIS